MVDPQFNISPHQQFWPEPTMNLQEIHNPLCPFTLTEGVSAQTPQFNATPTASSFLSLDPSGLCYMQKPQVGENNE